MCVTLAAASAWSAMVFAQTTKPAVSLDPPTGWELQVHAFGSDGKALSPAPPNFRRFGEARGGVLGDLHTLTLRFAETATLTGLVSTADFKIEGGSCIEGSVYARDATCTVLMRFTPQGPGNRLGHLKASTGNSASPMDFGLGGIGYFPALSFIPATISTVPGTYVNSFGLLNTATDLAIDGGDTLYVADRGNDAIRMMDSSGKFKTISDAGTTVAPVGVAVDSFGDVFFSQPSTNEIYEIRYGWSYQTVATGVGTDSCFVSTSPLCLLQNEQVNQPVRMSIIPGDILFFTEAKYGAAMSQIYPQPTFARLFDPFGASSVIVPFAVDQSGSLYGLALPCEIVVQPLEDAALILPNSSKVAGGRTCGFSGDGGQARNAEINPGSGQIAFDVFGNLYFADTANQRVRRIDRLTGIIRTIAGNGTAGYSGDGGPATAATLGFPFGVAVDSRGQVYVISLAGAPGIATTQVIRKLSGGRANFGNQTTSTSSAPKIVVVSNTGNAPMTLTNKVITGTSAADFSVDPNTTSCNLATGAVWDAGKTCTIGFLFKPSATGGRGANFTLLNDTVTNSNTVVLYGTGVLPKATMTVLSPTAGQSFKSGAAVTFGVSVTSSSGAAPTGTVQFKVDGANLGGPVTLASGKASLTLSNLTTAAHTLSATYSGDAHYAPGGPVSVSIAVTAAIKAATSVIVTPGANPADSCRPVVFTILVNSPGGVIPTGEVTLETAGRVLARASLLNGKATVSVNGLQPGTYAFTSVYGGDAHHSPSQSGVVQEVVKRGTSCLTGKPIGGPLTAIVR